MSWLVIKLRLQIKDKSLIDWYVRVVLHFLVGCIGSGGTAGNKFHMPLDLPVISTVKSVLDNAGLLFSSCVHFSGHSQEG